MRPYNIYHEEGSLEGTGQVYSVGRLNEPIATVDYAIHVARRDTMTPQREIIAGQREFVGRLILIAGRELEAREPLTLQLEDGRLLDFSVHSVVSLDDMTTYLMSVSGDFYEAQ